MVSFLLVIPRIEYGLIFGLFAFLILDYLSMVNTVNRSESGNGHFSRLKIITVLIGLAFITTLLVIATTMINA
jgi:hypothetical protein